MKTMMKKMGACAAACLLTLGLSAQVSPGAVDYNVIPQPQAVTPIMGGAFQVKTDMSVVYPKGNKQMQRNAEFLAGYLKELSGVELQPVTKAKDGEVAVRLSLGLDNDNKEAYVISVSAGGISIQGASEAGVFYGIQTLRKSVPVAATGTLSFPYVLIADQPRFSYRGTMLDTGRHFFPVDFIKKYIDILAMHNVNTLHWHLTEDQGWRFEVKRYPELAKKGGRREQTMVGRHFSQFDGVPYEGYYTQEECREVVKYAAERYINVVPEIDLPGHMQSALSVFPELGCTGGPYEVRQTWGVSPEVLCAGNPKTIEFIQTVLGELIKVFPSHYIHIGGDECPKDRWKNCGKCQNKIKELGITPKKGHTAEEQLQSYVINQAEQFLNKHGRDIIGWDEILEGGLAPNATVMSWRGFNGGVEAARQKHKVIMTPTGYCYFDYYQSKDHEKEPLAIGGYVPVSTVYQLEPMPDVLTDDEKEYIIGTQCNLWTEYIATPDHVEYMLLPRLGAMCEVQWTQPQNKNYESFLKRMPRLMKQYDRMGFNYAKHLKTQN